MIGLVWLCIHCVCYAITLLLVAVYAGRFIEQRRANTYAVRIERIAKMEIQLGIGLDYGRDWLVSQPIMCKDYLMGLALDHNGAVERVCYGCNKKFRPHDEYHNWCGCYKNEPKLNHELSDRLCNTCYTGAIV